MKRSTLFALLLVLFVLAMANVACDDGNDLLDDVIEGEKQNWSEITGSITDNPGKNTGLIGGAGKMLCEARGGRWVASIDACYEK